jgi:hypothetical protein
MFQKSFQNKYIYYKKNIIGLKGNLIVENNEFKIELLY